MSVINGIIDELDVKDPYEIHILEPSMVSFSRSQGGVFQGVIEGKTFEELILYRIFPFQYTTQYISVRNSKGEELGVVLDIDQLDEESRTEIDNELKFRYFLPLVTRIDSIKQKADLWIWELQTNLGPTRIVMRNLHEHMQYPSANRIILTDINGKRCEIRDWTSLDGHSRSQLKDAL
ncbi:DUF1854 domain-containing protein [Paenibacillus sp. KQZ6P-2]|uniref:DUF1854 domain-containing protein n=1 Tax=Paenibacillus mangrovi TaxID=2931978 RepID=A0A9X1WPA6_9BACL|nr:DUF1854 domain-containing protein [Paenibacillus mangrovi]MCJ8012176.1 DUF1854 domain-containing protein [Paenibacillus mangrovi]